MPDVLSFPFRLAPGGSAATVPDGSSDANAEAIALLALTRRGERPLVPTYGTTDPAFGDLAVAELNAGLATFGPPGVTVTGADTTYPDDTTARVDLTYQEA